MTVRTALLSRYAVPWLLALHDQDQEGYANILYETCVELADDRIVGSEVFDLTGTDVSRRMKFFESALRESVKEVAIRRLDTVLFSIVKITQASVTFTCSDQLLAHWFNLATEVALPKKVSGS